MWISIHKSKFKKTETKIPSRRSHLKQQVVGKLKETEVILEITAVEPKNSNPTQKKLTKNQNQFDHFMRHAMKRITQQKTLRVSQCSKETTSLEKASDCSTGIQRKWQLWVSSLQPKLSFRSATFFTPEVHLIDWKPSNKENFAYC